MTDITLRARVDYPDHGINAGDLLIVQPATEADLGRLVVVEADGGQTINRLSADSAGRVAGVVAWIYRSLES